jgi:5'-3' exonuclease
VQVHVIDGTYELFRHYFALPSHKNEERLEVAATRGVVRSVVAMLHEGATHVGVATDHVIESFRNKLWADYKTGEGIAPDLLSQFPILEESLVALGVVVWPMTRYEADDALAAAAREASAYAEQVVICANDKDLGQCVQGNSVVQFDRRGGKILDEPGIIEKFGVPPGAIPDYLALVGDAQDGYPGLPGWGAKSASLVLSKFGSIENIPDDASTWGLSVRGAAVLGETLQDQRKLALLFKDLATLRTSVPVRATEERLRWDGPRRSFRKAVERIDAPDLAGKVEKLAASRRT